jgi:CDP-6-deoxy-D-xylo-4-hexulose-3-dehydrase
MNYGAIPVFCDIDIETVNIKIDDLEKAISSKTKAIFIAHTLGNPFNIDAVEAFCKKYHLWLISDCCDSLGSMYKGKSLESYGNISTSSFFPAHHLTTGQGGAIHTNDHTLYKIAKSFASWGRDFKCDECKSNCEKRFDSGYDCRYSYNEFGLNLRPTEMQAAIGCAQLTKLPEFIDKRQKNYLYLLKNLELFDSYFYFQKLSLDTVVSPFAFLITLKPDCKFIRNEIVQYLEKNNIETRFLFAGNILCQKCFKQLTNNIDYRIIGSLENTDYIMNNSFFIGVYPGMTNEKLQFMVDKIKEFVNAKTNKK